MNKLLFLLISICLIKIIVGEKECFNRNATSVDDCENKGNKTYSCCYVTYRNDNDSEYKSICIEINKTDIKKGHHEETIKKIESGSYNTSNWDEERQKLFKNYSSIDNFDCKGKYISNSLLLLSSLFLFLI